MNIPEGITEIANHCFYATGVKAVKLPKSLRSIGDASFAENRFLKEIVLPEGVETLGVDAFGGCRTMHSITLPSTLKRISRGAFWKCKELKEISIPAGCRTIGEYAFYYCDNLKNIYNYSLEPQDIPVIFNSKDITIHVPEVAVSRYKAALHWKDYTIVGM